MLLLIMNMENYVRNDVFLLQEEIQKIFKKKRYINVIDMSGFALEEREILKSKYL